jgi:hypothetical protein
MSDPRKPTEQDIERAKEWYYRPGHWLDSERIAHLAAEFDAVREEERCEWQDAFGLAAGPVLARVIFEGWVREREARIRELEAEVERLRTVLAEMNGARADAEIEWAGEREALRVKLAQYERGSAWESLNEALNSGDGSYKP